MRGIRTIKCGADERCRRRLDGAEPLFSPKAKMQTNPLLSARKGTPFVYRTKGVSFQLNPPLRVGEIIFDDEIPFGDDIRLGGGRVDLISSTIVDFICKADFILASARISLYYGVEVVAVAENKLADLSMDFAVRILKLTDRMKGHYSLVNQLERSMTSIGANIREAKYAHSRPDFVAKLQIALKECYETEYWLELMQKAELSLHYF